jgi:hypothetical protein
MLLPRSITITPNESVSSTFTADGPVEISIVDGNGDTLCQVEIRGLYIGGDKSDVIELSDDTINDLRNLIAALRENGLDLDFPTANVVVRFNDMFGKLSIVQLAADGSNMRSTPPEMILHASIWTGGYGFHFDDGAPDKFCPKTSARLQQAISDAQSSFFDAKLSCMCRGFE